MTIRRIEMNRKWIAAATAAALLLTACGGGATAAAPQSGAASGTGEVTPLTVRMSTTFSENETGGMIIKYFMDKLSETSGDAITVKINWGGTLFDSKGEFDAVSDGAVDLVPLGHMPHVGTLNYLSFPGFAPGGTQKALDYFNELIFHDPETSRLIQEEAADYNIKYLNVIAGGTNALCGKYAFTDLDGYIKDSKTFGNFMAAQWESLGFQVTTITPPDVYDGLNRGLIDSTQMALAPMTAMAWYEVAPYWALDGTYTAGNMFTVNLDWWEGLTPEQQNAIETAAKETEQYSRTIYDEAIASDIALIEEKTGHKFVEFSQADIDRLWAACFDATAGAAMDNAGKNGKAEGMETILNKAAELTGYDWQR